MTAAAAGPASARALRIDGLANARDLGGMRLRDGGRTPRGVLARSETLDLVTARGWDDVRAAGIRTLLDLRQPVEHDTAGFPRPADLHVVDVDLDGLDDHPGFWADYWDNGLVGTALYFLPHLDALPDRAGAALRAIIRALPDRTADAPGWAQGSPEGGVLFHCGAGRDRTGLIAMLLLRAAGVEDEDIVDDYLETMRLSEIRARNHGREDQEPAITALLATRGTTTEQAFRDALAGLDLDRFLDAAGFTADERTALRTWRGAIPGGG